MPRFHPRIRPLVVGASAIALVAIGVGGTVAASNPPTLYACYDVYGNVRVSDKAMCQLPGGGRLASWGTAAVPGPVGATGPIGATGPTGATGPNAITADTACTTPGYSSTVTFDALGATHCGSGLSIDLAPGAPVDSETEASLRQGLAGFGQTVPPAPIPMFGCGGRHWSVGLPCSGVVQPSLENEVFVANLSAFALRCPDGSAGTIEARTFYWAGWCVFVPSGNDTVTIMAPAP